MERNELCWCGSGKKYKRCHMPIEEKMLIAENLLITTNYSITEISLMSGFHNYPHFLSTFKNLHGQTASEYRNNFIKNNKRD